MNILEPWNIVYLVGFVIFVVTRGVFARSADREKKTIDRFDGQEKALLGFMAVGHLLLPVLYFVSPWLAFADLQMPEWTHWIGSAVMVASLWLFWRSHADLGLNWSVSLQVRDEHQLIKYGVFSSIRHPMYASIWLWGIAQALLLENWLAGWGTLVPFAVLYFIRAPREERMLCEVFGEEYRDYMASTGRLFPRLGMKKRS